MSEGHEQRIDIELFRQATVVSIPNDHSSGSGDDGGASLTTRAVALGTTAYTIGATVGPALGGRLASSSGDGGGSDLYVGARLAVWLSLISAALSRTSGTIVAMNMAGRKRRRRRMRVTTTTTMEGIFEGGKIATRRHFCIFARRQHRRGGGRGG